MPYFSIVIPTYNRSERVLLAIDSVLQQTYTDFEIIVVDDGSTDNTKNRIAAIDDPRIHYHYQENSERGKARNTGVKNASGTYVFFLDSDDILYPSHLAHAHAILIKKETPAFLHIRYEEIDPQGNKRQVPTLRKETILQTIQRQNQFACQFFLKKEVAEKFPFSENRALKIGEDWDIILKISFRYPLHFSNEVHAAIVQHEERSMQIADGQTVLQSRDLLIQRLQADEKATQDVIQNVWVELTHLAALSYSIHGKRKKARKQLRLAAQRRPAILVQRRTFAIFKKLLTVREA